MTEKEFSEAYSAFVQAVKESRDRGEHSPVAVSFEHACVLEMYMFDPEAGFDEEESEDV